MRKYHYNTLKNLVLYYTSPAKNIILEINLDNVICNFIILTPLIEVSSRCVWDQTVSVFKHSPTLKCSFY